jgi:hypothetical protein
MKCRAVAVAVLLGTFFFGSSAQARGPYGSISVGNWKGGAYTNDQTGAFSHCAAGAQYASGIYFLVTIDVKGGWGLGFMHEKWTLTPGQAFPLTLTFDGQQPFNVHGVPIAEKLVRVPMPTNSSLIAQFRKAKAMTAYTQGQLFQFNLDQTGQLLPVLAKLRRQDQAIGRRQRRRFLGPSCRQAGGRGGAVGFFTGQARQTVRPDRHRLSRQHEWTSRD